MPQKHLTAERLEGKTIDCHSHVGVNLKAYLCLEYPYAETIEGIRFRQDKAGVDVNVVFPAAASLFFDPEGFCQGEMRPAKQPLSPVPYAVENEMLMLEVYEFNPEIKARFMPFVSVDPGRMIAEQICMLERIEERFPFYGIKISPVECQSPVTSLLCHGRPILEFAARRDLPILLHTTVDPKEEYSHAKLAFQVAEANPHIRFCFAHCVGFHQGYLDKAAGMRNVWVDTSALKIQTQCVLENIGIVAAENDRLLGNYTDHTEIMAALASRYPDTIIWGTDSPYYTFICRRRQGDGVTREFKLRASYEDEVSALHSLPSSTRVRVCNVNTLRFLFGKR